MLKKTMIAISLFSIGLLSYGQDAVEAKSYDGVISRLKTDYQSSLRELNVLGVGEALKLESSFGIINDEQSTYRLPALYWVHTKKDEKVKLSRDEITTIPVAFNNILENIAEHGWDQHIQVSDEEFRKWQAAKGKTASQYVDEDLFGKRTLKNVDDMLYYKAVKIYKQAQADEQSLAEKDMDKISVALEKYLKANVELSMIMNLQRMNGNSRLVRAPASVGEHAENNK